jgi:hypothetical protein
VSHTDSRPHLVVGSNLALANVGAEVLHSALIHRQRKSHLEQQISSIPLPVLLGSTATLTRSAGSQVLNVLASVGLDFTVPLGRCIQFAAAQEGTALALISPALEAPQRRLHVRQAPIRLKRTSAQLMGAEQRSLVITRQQGAPSRANVPQERLLQLAPSVRVISVRLASSWRVTAPLCVRTVPQVTCAMKDRVLRSPVLLAHTQVHLALLTPTTAPRVWLVLRVLSVPRRHQSACLGLRLQTPLRGRAHFASLASIREITAKQFAPFAPLVSTAGKEPPNRFHARAATWVLRLDFTAPASARLSQSASGHRSAPASLSHVLLLDFTAQVRSATACTEEKDQS